MNIILLEDEKDKREMIMHEVLAVVPDAEIRCVGNWLDYSRQIVETKFDLILLDLLVPRSGKSPEVEDHHIQLVETTRDYESKSFRTPAIVLTRYIEGSEDFLYDLNRVDINVIYFDEAGAWKDSLRRKVLSARSPARYDFVIVCALEKEALAYEPLVDSFGAVKVVSGLVCREILIGANKGVIVLAPRMGLVASAVTASIAVERFEPRLLCMSGICGGIPGNSNIYDVLITDVCHQHDAGKWSDDGFKLEHYDVQIQPGVRAKLMELVSQDSFLNSLCQGLIPGRSEIPDGVEHLSSRVRLEPTSSGSAVMAQEGKTESLSVGQRKLAGFDMEVFSVYEAARHGATKPIFFAAKTVVDDGGRNKGDRFHRIGCLLSAKVVVGAIGQGLIELYPA